MVREALPEGEQGLRAVQYRDGDRRILRQGGAAADRDVGLVEEEREGRGVRRDEGGGGGGGGDGEEQSVRAGGRAILGVQV